MVSFSKPELLNIAELFKYRFRSREDVSKTIHPTNINNLHILPSSKRHKHTLMAISSNTVGNNNIILKKALAAVKDDYDYIPTPPLLLMIEIVVHIETPPFYAGNVITKNL